MATLGNFTAAILTAAELNAIGTWTTWTPTFSGLTKGNGTVTARYSQINKVVHLNVLITFGSTSAMTGLVAVSLPVTAATGISSMGVVRLEDAGSTFYVGTVQVASATSMQVFVNQANGTYTTMAATSSTVPFTWTTNDNLVISLTYEAA
jgi:hypothetical protein